jgi:hypothetical protein
VGGDLRRDAFPDFERTIAIGEPFRTRNGGEAVVLSIELWSDRVRLHFAFEVTTPPMLGADGHGRPGPDFALSDDRNTTYRGRGGGTSAGDSFGTGYTTFSPGVPDEAEYVVITSRDLSGPIRVVLAP